MNHLFSCCTRSDNLVEKKNLNTMPKSKSKFYQIPSLNILVLGQSSVGKTSLIQRLRGKEFFFEQFQTMGLETEIVHYQNDQNPLKVMINDMSGNPRFREIALQKLQKIRQIVLVYSCIDRESFEYIKELLDLIKQQKGTEANMILISNKVDMKSKTTCIPQYEGRKLAEEYNMPFFECSAKSGQNIDVSFSKLIQISQKLSTNCLIQKIMNFENHPLNPNNKSKIVRQLSTSSQAAEDSYKLHSFYDLSFANEEQFCAAPVKRKSANPAPIYNDNESTSYSRNASASMSE